jgi:hypothetical protein
MNCLVKKFKKIKNWKIKSLPMLGGSPCQHSVARPRGEDRRDGLQQWRSAANILNKLPRITDKG